MRSFSIPYFDSHVLCQNTGRKSNWKVISLTLKVISFFFLADFSPWNFFQQKKKDITKKKRISRHISFDFLGQNPGIISAKRLPQTAKNDAKKKSTLLKSTFSKLVVPIVGYFWKKTHVFFFCKKYAKNALYLGKFRKKKLIWDHFFAENEQKTT